MKETILKNTVSAAIGNKAIRSMLKSAINKENCIKYSICYP